jgi:hypothetical protein
MLLELLLLVTVCIVRVVNRPSHTLNQLSRMVSTTQISGGDLLVESDRSLALGALIAHHNDSRHDRLLLVDGTSRYHQRAGQTSMAIEALSNASRWDPAR